MTGRHHVAARRWFSLRRPRLKPVGWVLLGCLVADLVVLATLGASDMDDGAKSAPSGTAGQGQPLAGASLASPPIRVCGNSGILGGGPQSAPAGAVSVPAGDNSGFDFGQTRTTYWFAPGTHTLGSDVYSQIIPGRGSTYIGAPGAVLNGRNANYYAFGGTAANVTISYLTIEDFGFNGGNQNQGVVNKDSAAGWTVDHSTVRNNAGAGAMLGRNNKLLYNCLADNQQYGFNAYSPTGPANLVLEHNEIAGNDTYNWEAHIPDCGCTGGGKFWDVKNAVITGNWIHGNHSVGLWADTNNRGFDIENNYISDNYGYGLIYEISYNARVEHNTFLRNGIVSGPQNKGFPTSAIYISESGGDSRVHSKFSGTLLIADNSFIDNWGGVILWENANRFCSSPTNTSTGACTLVNPAATVQSCNAHNIAHQPYYDVCRWKTQNVSVEHNLFSFRPADIGSSCNAANSCGLQGLFSEYGTFPTWSPYQKTIVEKHITFDQNNHFSSNVYRGPWEFMVNEQGNIVTWVQWQGKPYGQDKGSALHPLSR